MAASLAMVEGKAQGTADQGKPKEGGVLDAKTICEGALLLRERRLIT